MGTFIYNDTVMGVGMISFLYAHYSGFGGGGGGVVKCHKEGRSPCSRHEAASGRWVRESPLPI